ncbi:hypothetical protein RRG08_011311 [Elysia crispata]|uniref:Uncharacterized protein n=1 Tax=Elysia crispata TaxID=231223 RepID=A0AAE1B1T7_9GAST|nr:hypothetical protein RRG08_011311 [Elysia crispata]
MENQFVSSMLCAPDRWKTSLCHLYCVLQIDGEPVCGTCDVRSRLMDNQFSSPVLLETWMIKCSASVLQQDL